MAVVGTALFVLLDAPFEKLRLTLGITLLAALIENIKKGRRRKKMKKDTRKPMPAPLPTADQEMDDEEEWMMMSRTTATVARSPRCFAHLRKSSRRR